MKTLKNLAIVAVFPVASTYFVLFCLELLFSGGDWLAEKLTGAM